MKFLLSTTFLLLFCGCSSSPEMTDKSILGEICEANGMFNVYNAEEISFTFNVHKGDKKVKRQWNWNVQSGKVTVDGVAVDEKHRSFVNDTYWLIFPLRAYESQNQCEIFVNKNAKSPIAGEQCTEVIVKYITGEGYTPNDTYIMYVDNDLKIKEWSFLKAGKTPAALVTTWTDYGDFNGIQIPLMRQTKSGQFKLFFTDVKIR